ncbi:hypothetical protein [Kurthia huakuii]|uniref:hypothetical protein n=1 Tax=Kurthia huakuii TaxID=1421019 RepID=UPI0004952508|nr:hypothetical protein [Kurthia huakuii]MBM7699773.1 hypothetical protein [Kurthia huakuii]
MKTLKLSVSVLSLTTFLLGCENDTKEVEKSPSLEEQQNNVAKVDKPNVVTTASADDNVASTFQKEAKALKGRTVEKKAAYILKKYPKDLEQQSDYMEGIAKEHKETYTKEVYRCLFQQLREDYEAENYRKVDDQTNELSKIYAAQLVTNYAEQIDSKVMYNFSKRYTDLLKDYYMGYDSKENLRLNSYLNADKRAVDDAYRDLVNLVQ